MRAFLVFVAVIGFGAVAGAVVVGLHMFEGTVVDKPYEEGLTWEKRQRARIQSGMSASIQRADFRTGLNIVAVKLTRNGDPAAGEKAELVLRRPGTAAFSERHTLSGNGDGSYAAAVELPLPGRWEAVVVVYQGGVPLEFPSLIHAAGAIREADPGRRTASCDIDAGPCRHAGPDGKSVSLEITPRPVRAMKELLFTVRFDEGQEPGSETLLLHLDMPGMYMGENRVVLRRREGGAYSGPGIIVRCPSGGRTWRASLDGPETGRAAFTFEVDAP